MTDDQEIISAWMEAKPEHRPDFHDVKETQWWRWRGYPPEHPTKWRPRLLDLDALWEVEERLRMELTPQWVTYVRSYGGDTELALHATPFQRIRALAAVLRPIVEPTPQTP